MKNRPVAIALYALSAIPVFGGLVASLIFGTFASTALTLLVIPLMYYLWERRGLKCAA